MTLTKGTSTKSSSTTSFITRRYAGILILLITAIWSLFTLGPIAMKLSGRAASVEWHSVLAPPLIVAALLVASYFVWLARACARGAYDSF
jgi:hypothetical protein